MCKKRQIGALIGFSLFAPLALAVDVTLTWQNPTEYMDNTPLPPSEIQATELTWGACNDLNPPELKASVQGTLTTYKVQGLSRGEWCFYARTVVISGERSEWSDPALVVFTSKPKQPVLSIATSSSLTVVVE